ncbi:MAG: type II toxin-antitoxin system VapC family toxin [Deltaproteobacteria bacterium]|nr:type II toxin-antitoxin system VapC family toxin [Deltaproteobacteria bacterium]
MRLLLDTHIWLWSHLEPERLARRVASALVAPGNEIWVSPISIWELLLLVEKGRVVVDGDPLEWIEAAWLRAPTYEAAINREVAQRSRSVRVPYQDPADRFLAATAEVFDLTLVTGDERLLRGKGYRTLANR